MPTVTHTTHSYDKHKGFEVEYTETSVFTTALSYRRGYLLRAFLQVTLPLPTVAHDRATLEQEALPLVLRGDGQTAALQPLGKEQGRGHVEARQ